MSAGADKPAAEYWLGAHPSAPSIAITPEGEISLDELIRRDPQFFLGEFTSYDELSFLLKVLDVKEMLSIQVHPNKKAAEIGFDKENNAGIPINAPNRNYKDRNGKDEGMSPLSEFWLL